MKLLFGAIFEVAPEESIGPALQSRRLSTGEIYAKSRRVRKRPALSSALQRCERTVRGGIFTG